MSGQKFAEAQVVVSQQRMTAIVPSLTDRKAIDKAMTDLENAKNKIAEAALAAISNNGTDSGADAAGDTAATTTAPALATDGSAEGDAVNACFKRLSIDSVLEDTFKKA